MNAAKKNQSFSVVIPLFNQRDLVLRAVKSVFSQTASNYEVIIVDDGSTDGSAEQVAPFLIDKPNCRLISQTNRGVGAARNAGIQQAKYDWVAFLDADDAWFPEHLEELSRVIASFSNAGLVSTSFIQSRACELSEVKRRSVRRRICKIDYLSLTYRKKQYVNASCVAVQKAVFEALGGFGHWRPGQDIEMWVRIALEYPVAVSSRVTSVYFRGTGGVIESLQGNAHDDPVKDLSSLSPALVPVLSRISGDFLNIEDKSIRNNINGRLVQGIKVSFVQGKPKRLKSFSSLKVEPASLSDSLWFAFARLPEGLIDMLSKNRKLFKSVLSLKKNLSQR